MNSNHSSSHRRRWLAGAVALALLSGGYFAWAGTKDDTKVERDPVVIKVDSTPLARVEGGQLSYAPIVKRVIPSVVKVVSREEARENVGASGQGDSPFDDPLFRRFFGPMMPNDPQHRGALRRPPQVGLGSGVIVSADGYILTNNHVVDGADKVRVTLNDGREFSATVVGKDERTDIAVIKIDATDLPAATFAESEKVEVGDRVLAVGNPFGLGQTVTTGIVSATGRAAVAGLAYEDFIQTDAAINPGNSGGALVDMHGRLIGINTAILSRTGGFQGIGFAIPSDLARQIMDSLVQSGKVTRGFLGVGPQDLTPTLAEKFGLKDRKGVLVGEVTSDSPAAKAGIETGDVILRINEKEMSDARRLLFTMAAIKPGTEIDVTVWRDGAEKSFEVTVGARPDDPTAAVAPQGGKDDGVLDGVGVADLTPEMRREFEVPRGVQGAIVTEVDPSSAAAEAGLRPGDVIQEINRQSVRSAEDAVRMTEKTGDGKTLLRIWSRGASTYIVVDESEQAAPGRR
jgi:serine protease Do